MGNLVLIVWDIAALIGLVVMACVGLAVALAVVIALLRYWPVRWTFLTASQRGRQNRAVARIDWRSDAGMLNPLNALIGLSSRGKSRWFVGLMLLGPTAFDADLRWPKPITRKPVPAQPQADREG